MYLSYYNLQEKPFQITTDPKFLWMGEKHLEALSTMTYGIMESKGFLLLTGEVGTGKTVLINRLSTMVEMETIIATIPDPDLSPLDFFNFLAHGFNLKRKFKGKGDFLLALREFLHRSHADNQRVLLIIDEAQRLHSELLEEIRMLSNIELHDRKLINIFFVGQDEFHQTLQEHKNRAVAQRISVRYHIDPLTETETGDYIEHRLKIAGTNRKIFKSSALHNIYSFSGGIPRLINIICDHALLTGYAAGKRSIDDRMIKECAEELRIPEYKSQKQDKLQETLESIRQEISESLRRRAAVEPPAAGTPPGGKAAEKEGVEAAGENVGDTAGDNAGKAAPATEAPAGLEEGRPDEKSPAVEPEAAEPAEPERRPLLVKVVYVALLALIISTGVYLFRNYEAPKQNQEWKVDDLAPSKYKDTLDREGQNIQDLLAGKKTMAPPPEEPDAQPAAAPGDGEGSVAASATPGVPAGVRVAPVESPAPVTAEPEAPVVEEAPAVDPEEAARAALAGLKPLLSTQRRAIIIPFGHDSNDIPRDALGVLDRVAEFMLLHPGARLSINGYTDAVGGTNYNKRISEFRANTIKSYLVGKGADASRVATAGRGPEDPIASNRTTEGREANRRVELKFDDETLVKFESDTVAESAE